MDKFKQSMYNFFQGRYGIDELYKFFFIFFMVVWILNSFIKSPILYYLGVFTCIFMIYRVFSKKYDKRQKENMKYIELKRKFIGKIRLQKKKWNDRNTHIYRKCPNCKSELRLPKKRGKHVCTCPRCKMDFDVKC